MTLDQAVEIVRDSLIATLWLSSPILIAGLLIGLAISIFQAVTQIQDQTLSFVPKIVVMVVVMIAVAPWMGTMLLEFSRRMFAGP